jgi:hypothetical protein
VRAFTASSVSPRNGAGTPATSTSSRVLFVYLSVASTFPQALCRRRAFGAVPSHRFVSGRSWYSSRMRPAAPLSIAIVGMGPRGLSVLERLVLLLRNVESTSDVTIWAIEPVEHGSGRVWRTDQSPWLEANATASELTAHSPDSPLLAEDGASLTQWTLRDQAAPALDSGEYPARRRYGAYLHETFHRLCDRAPDGVHVHPVPARAISLVRSDGGLRLRLDDGAPDLHVDKAVLTTGHSELAPTDEGLRFQRHAERHPGLRYVGPGIAAEMPLDSVADGDTVAVRGLGLTFYDVVRSLSLGRGGRFVREDTGRLRYLPSGREPKVVAGSRSGLPFLARAHVRNPELAPRPVILTGKRVDRLRAAALDERGSRKLDFAAEVEPLIWAEVEHAYYRRVVGIRDGQDGAERFTEAFPDVVDGRDMIDNRRNDKVLAAFGLVAVPPLRTELLARPFNELTFPDSESFRGRLRDVLAEDVKRSRRGPEGSPTKAALEMLRTLRPALPDIVDFGGLLPHSHRDFLTRFVPAHFLLSAGPPPDHVEQLVSLLDAGVVEVVGPETRFGTDSTGCFVAISPRVAGSRREADVLLDARAPDPDLRHDRNPLLRQLLADGMISEYINIDPASGKRFHTGGLAVTPTPFHVLDAHGKPDTDLYALGVATQNTRWFTQVGTGRPNQDSPFCRDADAIARDLLSGRGPA